MVENYEITPHFSFYEMTVTNTGALQELNRQRAMDPEIRLRLKALCIMLEALRPHTGPLRIHSGFRCPELNAITQGSAKTSQHRLGEAVDFSTPKATTDEAMGILFDTVLQTLIGDGLQFGQLIRESATRDYGMARWIHLSLGVPFRDNRLCGQVLEAHDGAFKLLKVIPFGR